MASAQGFCKHGFHTVPEGGGGQDPWRLFEERVRTGPFGLSRFPSHPHSPMRILVLDTRISQTMSPRLTQFVRDSPPWVRGQWLQEQLIPEEEPGLTHEEFKIAMDKLRKQPYHPNPRVSWKRSLFHRRRAEDDELGDEEKVCAVCMETFVPYQEVLLTPCKHIFHIDCLVPWVKSHGQCPLCRFELCPRRTRTWNNNGVSTNNGANGPVSRDLISLVRAMEEALDWVSIPRD